MTSLGLNVTETSSVSPGNRFAAEGLTANSGSEVMMLEISRVSGPPSLNMENDHDACEPVFTKS